MYKHILVATDGSDFAAKAITTGLELAKCVGAKVTVVTVTEPWRGRLTGEAAFGFPTGDFEKFADAQAQQILDKARKAASEAGVECNALHVREHHPAEGVLDAAQQTGCDLIVMASHGRRGLGRLLLGSETVRVLTQTHIPVLVCR
ncbi:MAG: universal stress protein [Hyphomicrobiales bacterium]|nr:MAG: universal stress protein [Hyphomicrobiales bacterium]